MIDKFWEEGIYFYIDTARFQQKCNLHDEARFIQTMAWQLKNEGLHTHCTGKRSDVGLEGSAFHCGNATSQRCCFM